MRALLTSLSTAALLASVWACSQSSESSLNADAGLNEGGDDDSTKDGSQSSGAIVVEPLKLFVEGGSLDVVAVDPGHGYLAAGTVSAAGRSSLLIARIDGAKVLQEQAPNLGSLPCPNADIVEVAGLSISASRRGLLVGSVVCEDDGASTKIPFVLRYDAGKWSTIALADLPDSGGFRTAGVTCSDESCFIAASKTKGDYPLLDSRNDSSLTIYEWKEKVFTKAFEEWETTDDALFWPRTIAAVDGEVFVAGEQVLEDTQAALSRGKRVGEWSTPDGAELVSMRGARAHAGGFEVIGRLEGDPPRARLVRYEAGNKRSTLVEVEGLILDSTVVRDSRILVGEQSLPQGFTAFASVGTKKIALPYADGSSISTVASDGEVAVAVGRQSATAADGLQVQVPLVARFSRQPLGVHDGVFGDDGGSDEPDPGGGGGGGGGGGTSATPCAKASDCAGMTWGIKCQGHFECTSGTCGRSCDPACGDGICDAELGETKASCSDCEK